jgi:hypothetical protein
VRLIRSKSSSSHCQGKECTTNFSIGFPSFSRTRARKGTRAPDIRIEKFRTACSLQMQSEKQYFETLQRTYLNVCLVCRSNRIGTCIDVSKCVRNCKIVIFVNRLHCIEKPGVSRYMDVRDKIKILIVLTSSTAASVREASLCSLHQSK